MSDSAARKRKGCPAMVEYIQKETQTNDEKKKVEQGNNNIFILIAGKHQTSYPPWLCILVRPLHVIHYLVEASYYFTELVVSLLLLPWPDPNFFFHRLRPFFVRDTSHGGTKRKYEREERGRNPLSWEKMSSRIVLQI